MDAGLRSSYGEPLEKKVEFTFSTKCVEIVNTFPNSKNGQTSPITTPMAIVFNQKIDPEQVLSLISLSLSQDGFLSKLTKKTYAPVQMLSAEEISNNVPLKLFLQKSGEGCSVAFRCTKNFLHDSTVTVKIDGKVRKIQPSFEVLFCLTAAASSPRLHLGKARLSQHAHNNLPSAHSHASAYRVLPEDFGLWVLFHLIMEQFL